MHHAVPVAPPMRCLLGGPQGSAQHYGRSSADNGTEPPGRLAFAKLGNELGQRYCRVRRMP
eukprot:12657892-Prorocentrum_lima.AAC.1